MEIYLIRHTTPNIAKGICYGVTDISLNENLFAEELKHIESKLPNGIEHFYTSPLQRCKKLTQKLTSNYTEDSQLIELNFGDWENKFWNEIDKDQINIWMNDFVNTQTPNGENYLDLHQRTITFIETLLLTNYNRVCIITHSGNIRSFISWTLDLPLENSFRIELGYGAMVSLKINREKSFNKLISIQ
jgi:alpha-ribazole phosphatase